jgi:hypothetical protein
MLRLCDTVALIVCLGIRPSRPALVGWDLTSDGSDKATSRRENFLRRIRSSVFVSAFCDEIKVPTASWTSINTATRFFSASLYGCAHARLPWSWTVRGIRTELKCLSPTTLKQQTNASGNQGTVFISSTFIFPGTRGYFSARPQTVKLGTSLSAPSNQGARFARSHNESRVESHSAPLAL